MTFRDLCDVLGMMNLLVVRDRVQEDLAYGLVSEIRRDRRYLMDKGVLCIDSRASLPWEKVDSYITVVLDVRKEELFK